MDQHPALPEQPQGAVLARIQRRAAQDRRPAALHPRPAQARGAGQQGVQGGQVGPEPDQDPGLDGRGQLQEGRGGRLGGG